MPFTKDAFEYGPVFVLRGKHKGRIGELDDDTTHRNRVHGIVKFAMPLITPYDTYIPMEYLQPPNTQQLMKRHNELMDLLSPYKEKEERSRTSRSIGRVCVRVRTAERSYVQSAI